MSDKIYSEMELRNLKLAHGETIGERGSLRGRANIKKNGDLKIRWAYRYRSPQSKITRDIGCGTWPTIKMKDIRRARDTAELLVKNGRDPNDEANADKLAARRRLIEEQARQVELESARQAEINSRRPVSELFSEWIRDLNHYDSNKEVTWRYGKYIDPAIGHIPVKSLTEQDLKKMLKGLVDKGMNRTAVLVHENLASAFAWGEKRQPWRRLLVEGNPVLLVNIDRITTPGYRNIRERFLSPTEIGELDTILYNVRQDYAEAPVGTKYGHLRPIGEEVETAIWIMLSTLCRVGETSKAEWRYVDFQKKEWFIPREHVKKIRGDMHKSHLIFLSDFTLVQLNRLKKLTGHTPYLFPARRGDKGHLNEKAITKQITDRQVRFSKAQKPLKNRKQDNTLVLNGGEAGKWISHDLRRTGSTMMQLLGIERSIINLCQNHLIADAGSSDEHYLLYKYGPQMRDAWAKWGSELEGLARHAKIRGTQ